MKRNALLVAASLVAATVAAAPASAQEEQESPDLGLRFEEVSLDGVDP